MRRGQLGLVAIAACLALLLAAAASGIFGSARADMPEPAAEPAPAVYDQAVPYSPSDPGTWTNAQLGAQMTFTALVQPNLGQIEAVTKQGVGGIILLGDQTASPKSHVEDAQVAAAGKVAPLIASDEEGGNVQPLRKVLGSVPSARTMGTWSPAEIEKTAKAYGEKMLGLGVRMDLGPVADLAVSGSYLDNDGRAFSSDPAGVTASAGAWIKGMKAAGVMPVIKHWPGHGHALNTHKGAAVIPPMSELENADLIPFRELLAEHPEAVMVGHLKIPGLTEGKTPASESPAALKYLREQTGPDTVIMTDSLSMGASANSLGISPATAAARAIAAGADWAVVCTADPKDVARAITKAIDNGTIPRAQAITSVTRILKLKATVAS